MAGRLGQMPFSRPLGFRPCNLLEARRKMTWKFGKSKSVLEYWGVNKISSPSFYERGSFRRKAAHHKTPPLTKRSILLLRSRERDVADTSVIYETVPAVL